MPETPKLSARQRRSLQRALHSVQNAEQRWRKLQDAGATDAQIKEQLRREFGIAGGSHGPDYSVDYRGGKNPRVWFDKKLISKPPDLSGKALIQAVRSLLEIPSLDPQPSTPNPQPPMKTAARTTQKPRGKPLGAAAIAAGRKHLGAESPETRVESRKTAPQPSTLNPPPAEGATLNIPTAAITASPFQPRRDFDQAKLQDLAHSLKRHGQLQPLVVRAPLDGKYELIAGERRWRAAKLARLKTVSARILDVTDEEAAELSGIENLQREDLNAIERAQWYRTLIDRCGYTQESLAKHLSTRGFHQIDQSTISKTIRLLDLPDAWQTRVRSGKLQPAAARELLPWLDTPAVLEALEKRMNGVDEAGFTVRDFAQEVNAATCDASRAMDYWPPIAFKPTKQQRKELDIRKVNGWQRAFNVPLFNKLQREAKKAERAKEPKATENTRKDAAPPPEPSFDEEECYELLQDFFASTLAGHLEHLELPLLIRLTLLLITKGQSGTIEDGVWHGQRHASLPKKLLSASDELLAKDLRGWLKLTLEADWYRRYGGDPWDPADWREISQYLSLDPLKGWEPTEEFLELLTLDELRALAQRSPHKREVEASFDELDQKSLSAWLVDHWPPGVIPQPILDVWNS